MQNFLKFELNNAQAYLIIGNIYSAIGNKSKAIEAYKHGLALNPKYNIRALLELGLENVK
jgi:tetratricopeptide (TPR) repeat protein